VYLIGSHAFYFIPSMGMPASVRHLIFFADGTSRFLIPGLTHSASQYRLVKIGNVFRPSDALLTSHIRGHLL
jgi:hypothetical protein